MYNMQKVQKRQKGFPSKPQKNLKVKRTALVKPYSQKKSKEIQKEFWFNKKVITQNKVNAFLKTCPMYSQPTYLIFIFILFIFTFIIIIFIF